MITNLKVDDSVILTSPYLKACCGSLGRVVYVDNHCVKVKFVVDSTPVVYSFNYNNLPIRKM